MAKPSTKDRRATITAGAADRTMTAEMSVALVTNPDGRIAFPKPLAGLTVPALFACTPEGKHAAEVHAKQIQAAKMPRNAARKKRRAELYAEKKAKHPARGDEKIAVEIARELGELWQEDAEGRVARNALKRLLRSLDRKT